MPKLEKLTPEQENLIPVVRDEWISFALDDNTPMDRAAAKRSIDWMYGLAKLDAPEVVYAQSPLACQIIANLYGNPKIWAELPNVGGAVRDAVWDAVGDAVRGAVGDAVWDAVRGAVRDAVWDAVWDAKLEYFSAINWDVLYDANWVAWGDYFTRIGVINVPNFNRYRDEYMRAGVFYGVFLEGVAIICGRPTYIKRDDQGRLHSPDGPAILWPDTWPIYKWHGVTVPEKLIEHPEAVTREDLIKETNAEVRRVYLEKLGPEQFFSLLDVEIVSKEYLGRPGYVREYVLYRTREEDPVAGAYLNFLQMECHSTGRVYVFCVPPDLTTARDARAWLFPVEDYDPVVET